MAKSETSPQEPNPFDKADSPSAIMAYVHAKMGANGLRALLAEITADREALQRDANELAEVGLPGVAAIVTEAAANALPAHVMHCPYAETDIHNFQSWQASHQRKFANRPTYEKMERPAAGLVSIEIDSPLHFTNPLD